MTPQLVAMHITTGHRLWLQFADGVEGEIELSGELWGPVFEPLRDEAYFGTARLDMELNTVCWESGADFAPEFLYGQTRAASASGSQS